MNTLNVILGPVISEKSMGDASGGKYTFKVTKSASKNDIKKAIEEKFKVNIVKISTITTKGKKMSVRTKTRNIEVDKGVVKKAVVKVKDGQKISIFDQGAKE